MSVSLSRLRDQTWQHKRKIFIGVLLFSAFVHILFGVGSTAYVIFSYFAPPKAQFVANRQITLPPKIIDPDLAAAEFEAAASTPVLDQKLSSLRPTEFSLPDVPKFEIQENVEFDPAEIISETLTSLTSGTGSGSGAGGGDGDGSGTGAMTFFGLKATGGRFVFVIDISGSMKGKYEPVDTELRRAIRKLKPSLLFNIVAFAGRSETFKKSVVSASDDNKNDVYRFLDKNNPEKGFDGDVTGGTRLDLALAQAFDLKPDVIVLLTDGAPKGMGKKNPVTLKNGKAVESIEDIHTLTNELQKKSKKPVKINTIAYKIGGTAANLMEELAKRHDGRFKMID